MKATYTKFRDGKWGVRVEGNPDVLTGQSVVVAKRDGSSKTEVLGQTCERIAGVVTYAIGPTVRRVTSCHCRCHNALRTGPYAGCERCGCESPDDR